MTIDELTVAELHPLLKNVCTTLDNPSKEVVQQVSLCSFWGARIWVIRDLGTGHLISFNMTKFGKRKKNVWEPYANWFLAFTNPEYRQLGYARAIGLHVRQLALEAGCRRMRSLAGSWAGVCMHNSLSDDFWGLSSAGEVVVDTAIDPSVTFPPGIVPGAVRNALRDGELFSKPANLETIAYLTGGKLRYDR